MLYWLKNGSRVTQNRYNDSWLPILVNMPFVFPLPPKSKDRHCNNKKQVFREANQGFHNYHMEDMTLYTPISSNCFPQYSGTAILHFPWLNAWFQQNVHKKNIIFSGIYVCTFSPVPQLHIPSEHKLACYCPFMYHIYSNISRGFYVG
jgi:hypothetical protein